MLKWAFAVSLLLASILVAAATGQYLGFWNLTEPVITWALGIPGMSRHVEYYRAGRHDWEEWQARQQAMEEWERDLRREAQRLGLEWSRVEEERRTLQQRADELRREKEWLESRLAELRALEQLHMNVERLRDIYNAMRPEEAARVMERLENETVVRILTAMEPRQAGRVLGQLDPQRAAELSRLIRERADAHGT